MTVEPITLLYCIHLKTRKELKPLTCSILFTSASKRTVFDKLKVRAAFDKLRVCVFEF